LANVYKALDANHEIVPVINKIDLPAAEPDRVKLQIEDVIGIDASEAPLISAKTGIGIDGVLETIITRLPAPIGDEEAPLKAMLVDSWYDPYLGIVVLARVVDGVLKKGMSIQMMATKAVYKVDRCGYFTPKMTDTNEIKTGELGFIICGIKSIGETRVGDTITDEKNPTSHPLPGFKPSLSVVFCSLFPVDMSDYEALKEALAKFDRYYPQPNGASPLQQLANQLANPLPYDLDETDLSQYKHLDEKYQDWNHVRDICAHIAVAVIHKML
jgi:GTP-binding protein LepA